MPQPPPRSDHTPKRLSRRLDRVFGEINPILLAVAIGLAVLDATCFSVIRLSDEFLRRISAGMENAWQLNAGRAVGLSSSGSTVSGESSAHTSTP
jgi:branched-subunit amino acid permease